MKIVTNNTEYKRILRYLLVGDHAECSKLIKNYIINKVPLIDIHEKIIKKALYEVGRLWEQNKISVETEHIASSIVEILLNEIYETINIKEKNNKTVIVSCLKNEYHQIGTKMVCDVFEMHGWDTHFLGPDTPIKDLNKLVQSIKPDVIGLSATIYFNIPILENSILSIQKNTPDIPILVGGQAFKDVGGSLLEKYKNVFYAADLKDIERFINHFKFTK